MSPQPFTRRKLRSAFSIPAAIQRLIIVPSRQLKRLYCEGHTDLDELSSIFMVSARALEVRLHQLGLRDLGVPASDRQS
jgi:hypothetical protein